MTITSSPPANTAATAAWVNNAQSIQIPSGLTIANGLIIYDNTTSTFLGTVTGYSGTTLSTTVLNGASGGATDSLSFEFVFGGEQILDLSSAFPVASIASFGTGTGGAGTYNLSGAGGLNVSGTFNALRRPSFNVAAVDYAVGATGGFVDPNGATLPAGCSWSATGSLTSAPQMACDFSATASVNTVSGFEFGPVGGHGCTTLAIANPPAIGTVNVTNNHVGNDANCGGNSYSPSVYAWLAVFNGQGSTVWNVTSNTVDGGSSSSCCNGSTLGFQVFGNVVGATTYQYNSVKNMQGREMQAIITSTSGFTGANNYIEGWDARNQAAHAEIFVAQGTSPLLSISYLYNTALTTFNMYNGPAPFQPILPGGGTITTMQEIGNVMIDNFAQGATTPTGSITSATIDNRLGTGPGSIMTIHTMTGTIGAGVVVAPTKGAPAAFNTLVAGSGYTNGTYTNVPMTGGSGTGLVLNVTVSGGAVTAVAEPTANYGTGDQYVAGDVVSASTANLGGTGSGFSIKVASIQTFVTVQNLSGGVGSGGVWSLDAGADATGTWGIQATITSATTVSNGLYNANLTQIGSGTVVNQLLIESNYVSMAGLNAFGLRNPYVANSLTCDAGSVFSGNYNLDAWLTSAQMNPGAFC